QDGTGGPYTYMWVPAITQISSSITVSPTNTVTYTVTVNDGCSPTITDSVTIHVLTPLQVSFSADSTMGCAPVCVNFTNTTIAFDDAVLSQLWSFGADQPDPQHCFNSPGVYDVSLTVITAMGCMYTYIDSSFITVYPLPIADFVIPSSNLIPNSQIDFTDYSNNALTWNWNFGDSFSSGVDSFSVLQNPIHIYSDTGYYCVNLSVTGMGGCVDSIQHCITIEPEYLFYIPNAFTPNEDGVNDTFLCVAQNVHSFEMSIFDRWGGLLFYSDDISKGWDGKNYIKEIEKSGVYIYKIEIIDNNKKKHKYSGNVTMIFGE
ncbi:MAG: gliding motility-associated C-terminal domain-containing protein, partial [Bacteroidia bacterium]